MLANDDDDDESQVNSNRETQNKYEEWNEIRKNLFS